MIGLPLKPTTHAKFKAMFETCMVHKQTLLYRRFFLLLVPQVHNLGGWLFFGTLSFIFQLLNLCDIFKMFFTFMQHFPVTLMILRKDVSMESQLTTKHKNMGRGMGLGFGQGSSLGRGKE